MIEKIVGVNGFDLEVPLTDHLAVFTYADRPGVVGQVGQILGDVGINIGGMQVARSEKRGSALVLLNVDVELPQSVAARIAEAIGAESFAVVNL
jgi:D-3-phosphoglycerate dehydrogenase / 2-oxoglutarate reductase